MVVGVEGVCFQGDLILLVCLAIFAKGAMEQHGKIAQCISMVGVECNGALVEDA